MESYFSKQQHNQFAYQLILATPRSQKLLHGLQPDSSYLEEGSLLLADAVHDLLNSTIIAIQTTKHDLLHFGSYTNTKTVIDADSIYPTSHQWITDYAQQNTIPLNDLNIITISDQNFQPLNHLRDLDTSKELARYLKMMLHFL